MMQSVVKLLLEERTLRIVFAVSGLALAMALAYGSGRLGGLWVSANILKLPPPQAKLPPLPNQSSLSDVGFTSTYFKDIVEQNVFDAAITPKEEVAEPELQEEAPPTQGQTEQTVETLQINFQLYGTAILSNSSYAWLGQDSPNNASIFYKNDCFSGELDFSKVCDDSTFKLSKVEKNRVAILVNSKEIWLERVQEDQLASVENLSEQNEAKERVKPAQPLTSDPNPAPQIQPEQEVTTQVETPQPQTDSQQEIFQIQRVWVDEQLANFGQILQDARVIPEIKGETTLFKFDWIREDSMYSRLGLQQGDIILSINDIIIDNIAKAMGLLNKLQSEREIKLEIEREEQRKLLQYYIN